MDCSMILLPEPAYDLSPLRPGETPLWQLVVDQFRLPMPTDHGASHWLTVLRNGMELCRHHPADEEIVRLFALFHDSCRHDEYADPGHGWRLLSTATTKNIAMQGAWHELEK